MKPAARLRRIHRYAALRRVLTRPWTKSPPINTQTRIGIATSHPGESGDVGELRKICKRFSCAVVLYYVSYNTEPLAHCRMLAKCQVKCTIVCGMRVQILCSSWFEVCIPQHWNSRTPSGRLKDKQR